MIFLFIIILIAVLIYWIIWTELLGASWLPTPKRSIERMMELTKLDKHDTFYDLGSGMGSVMKIVHERTGAKCVGIEADPIRVIISKLRRSGGRIVWGNVFKTDISDATVVFIYLRRPANNKLKERFRKDLRPGTRIITYFWRMNGWKPTLLDEDRKIYVYKIPQKTIGI
ncbi:MAG: SAM-dependent methyltransferase [Candidatus Aenigmatarchaeota archaeon]